MNAWVFQKHIGTIFRPRIVCILSTLFALTTLISACTQPPPAKTYTIGILHFSTNLVETVDGFKSGLAKAGYQEGQNVRYIDAGPIPEPENLKKAAQDLIDARVDLIFAVGTPPTSTLFSLVKGKPENSIPIVFWAILDPVAAGYAQSLQRPGGSLTGISIGTGGTPIDGRRLEWFKKIAPAINRVYFPHNPDDPLVVQGMKTVRESAAVLGIELVLKQIRTEAEAQAAAQSVPSDIDAIFILADRLVNAQFNAELALKLRLPYSAPNTHGTRSGALMSYSVEYPAIGEQASKIAIQILKGAKPGDQPIETPEIFLSINLKTAEALGLNIPNEILQQAQRVFR
jgi:putative ABC transport system substrate-binding protein